MPSLIKNDIRDLFIQTEETASIKDDIKNYCKSLGNSVWKGGPLWSCIQSDSYEVWITESTTCVTQIIWGYIWFQIKTLGHQDSGPG